ncbi:CoA-binding protein [uncultured Clostridium sp.]|uniref:CoA-binding protein n=1 Tax=uncultured Clostridium sp. TaxID=59620 RepID=UPI0028EC91B3|nr:CoA-binding protein [uncultured Clostridium sp.]
MDAQQLLEFKNWVVVGDVLNEDKYAYRILNKLIDSGFNAKGVSPNSDNNDVYKSLGDVPYKIDVIDLCINPKSGMDIVRQAYDLGLNKILIQPGAASEEILSFCKEKGIIAIEGCALVELSYYKRKR